MAWEKIHLIGFAPDLPIDTPGLLLTAASKVVPTDRGFGNTGYPTLLITNGGADAFKGGAVLAKVDGTTRTFGGTGSTLFELVSASSVPRGTGYSASTWSFAPFGDIALAITKTTPLQASASTTFATVGGAPKGSIVITPSLPNAAFVMVFDYDDGVDNLGDGIAWSALGNYTDWTPDIATEAQKIRITDIGGAFTAAIPFRDGVVAFKRRAMYLGRYVGGAAVWAWQRISTDIGCIGKNALAEANDALYFADDAGLWMYDGSYPRLMPGAVHGFWASAMLALTTAQLPYVRVTWDKQRHRLWFGYGSDGNTASDFIVFNAITQRWTQHGTLANAANTASVVALLTPDAALGRLDFQQMNWTTGFGGQTPAGILTCGVIGNLGALTKLNGVRPQWLSGGSGATWASGVVAHGTALRSLAQTQPMAFKSAGDGEFDISIIDRFLRPTITVAANTGWEVADVAVDISKAGTA